MTKFDHEIINSRVEKIRTNLVDLSKIAKLNQKDFASSHLERAAAERLLQTCIESLLDIGNHIIAVAGFEEPQEYRDIIGILNKRGVLNDNLTGRLQAMVGLRNRLVHLYMEIDYKKLHSFLSNNLADFDEFIKIVLKYTQK